METNSGGPEKSVVEHLSELRVRVIRAALVFLGLSVVFFPFAPYIMRWIQGQLFPTWELYVFSPTEAVLVQTKLALVFGLAVAAPFILYQLWAYIAPALKHKELTAIRSVVLPSFLLILASLLFAWKVLLPVMLTVLYSMTMDMAKPLFGLDKTLSLVTLFLFVSIVMFQLPLAFYILGRVGLFSRKWLAGQRKWAIIILAVAAAVITPDNSPVTMMILAVPLYLLFEFSVWLVGLAEKRTLRPAEIVEE